MFWLLHTLIESPTTHFHIKHTMIASVKIWRSKRTITESTGSLQSLIQTDHSPSPRLLNSQILEHFGSSHSPSCSSILSHSSSTKCLMFFKLRLLLWMRARVRPGVPTTMCGQFFFRTSSSFFMAMPPKNTDTLTVGMYLEKRSYSLLIWKANSRVWHITRTDTWHRRNEGINRINHLVLIQCIVCFCCTSKHDSVLFDFSTLWTFN